IDTPAGQRPLAGMIAQLSGTAGEDERGLGVPVPIPWKAFQPGALADIRNRDGDRCSPVLPRISLTNSKLVQISADELLEEFVSLHVARPATSVGGRWATGGPAARSDYHRWPTGTAGQTPLDPSAVRRHSPAIAPCP